MATQEPRSSIPCSNKGAVSQQPDEFLPTAIQAHVCPVMIEPLERQACLIRIKLPRMKIQHGHGGMTGPANLPEGVLHHEQGQKAEVASAADGNACAQKPQSGRGQFQYLVLLSAGQKGPAGRPWNAVAVVPDR